MHGSVLQNKKYIKFADENTVEVMALGRLDEGIQKGDKRAATYKAKDADGNEKEFLVGYPNLTVQDISTMRGSKAGSYNNTGKIPYTAIVNPHTLEEMSHIQGGFGGGKLMDTVEAHKKALEKQYGPSLSRKKLKKIQESDQEIRAEQKIGKAVASARALQKKVAKQPEAIQKMVDALVTDILKKASDSLDEADALLSRGDAKGAKKIAGRLASALRGTELEERAKAIIEKAKAATAK